MRKELFLLLFALMTSGLALLSPGQPLAADSAVVFKAVAFMPANNANVAGFNIFAQKVNEKFKNSIKIDLIGGPEVTPPFQLHEAVKSGVLDMCLTSCGYYPALVWEAQSAMFTNKNFKEISQTPYFDAMTKRHQEAGLVWLGAATYEMPFYMYTNVEVKAPKDLSGKRIRIFPPFIPFSKALGVAPINLPVGDIYTAMERGAVDGFVMTHFGFVNDFSWHEVSKYVIDYPLYQGTAIILANPKKWSQLPPEVQKGIIDLKKESIEQAISDYYAPLNQKDWKLMTDKGVKTLKFSKEDAEAFGKMAYESAWEQVNSKSPELGPKLKAMLVK